MDHLGYVFVDGKESGDVHAAAGERHCILSLCLDFVPSDQGSTDLPEFVCPPKVVHEHLEQQEQTARELIDSGMAVEMKANEKEEKREKQEPTAPIPPIQRQDTPQVPLTKSNPSTPEKKPKKRTQQKPPRAAPQQTPPPAKNTTTRGMPQGPTQSDTPFSSETRKPSSEESGKAVIIAPVVLALIGSVIIYFAYKTSQEKK